MIKSGDKKEHPEEKTRLHPRNKHRARYDFRALAAMTPELTPFVKLNQYDDESIDFANPDAVKMLNRAILKLHYDIEYWDIPENYLCPPIPGRADYIHYVSDLLAQSNNGRIPKGERIKCLDIGVGANCIYPLLGNREYGWSFIGSDIDDKAIESAGKIIDGNYILRGKVELRMQTNRKNIFKGIIQPGEWIDAVFCNPPFHESANEARKASLRKLSHLNRKNVTNPVLNFGGRQNELWCYGGEKQFVRDMAYQSEQFGKSCFWFSTLVSKESTLKSVYDALKKVEAAEIVTLPMGQGNKTSRIVAWTFLDKKVQALWIKARWK